jgi:type IX secretion system PorP/SprF family membrane protein
VKTTPYYYLNKMKIKIIAQHILFIAALLLSICCKAQDPVFTQYALVPETINPGFTGFQYDWRAGLLHRRQWPNSNRVMDTDYGFLNKMVGEHSGIGLTILNQREAFTNYNYIQINGVFSYKIELNDVWSIRPAIEAGYGRKSFNFQNLLLEDQIDVNTGAISGSSIDQGLLDQNDHINFIDISAGFVLDNENGWIGMNMKHLNRPNISFVNNGNVPLDLFLSIHGGYAFDIDNSPTSLFPENTKLLFTANYMRQSQFNRLDLGSAIQIQSILLGANVVTNPEGRSPNSHIITSVNPYLSVHVGDFNFGYSYDFSTSKIGQTQGIHEVSLTWQFRFCENCVAKVNKYYDYNK